MLTNQSVINKKPRDLAVTKSQGTSFKANGNSNSTPMLKDSKSRYEKGMGLYKSGRVSIGPNRFFKVSGFQVDPEKMQCECPDYRTRKEPCKHLFAAMLFVKNRGKERIEHLNGEGDWVTELLNDPAYDKPKPVAKDAPNTDVTPTKPFDRQSTITRLAVLNTATEILKTHRKPIEFNDIVSLAAQLEKWALNT